MDMACWHAAMNFILQSHVISKPAHSVLSMVHGHHAQLSSNNFPYCFDTFARHLTLIGYPSKVTLTAKIIKKLVFFTIQLKRCTYAVTKVRRHIRPFLKGSNLFYI